MLPEDKNGPTERMLCLLPTHGRIKPEEVMRRKLMQKMVARRERRLAASGISVRRAV
ncbi:MAG: hypothetical protein ACREFQ_17390 [Stellaceae bacterium]